MDPLFASVAEALAKQARKPAGGPGGGQFASGGGGGGLGGRGSAKQGPLKRSAAGMRETRQKQGEPWKGAKPVGAVVTIRNKTWSNSGAIVPGNQKATIVGHKTKRLESRNGDGMTVNLYTLKTKDESGRDVKMDVYPGSVR